MAESGCMASFSDVEARPVGTEEVVDQQAKACDAQGALAAATVTGGNDEATLQQEQHDAKAAPVPDHKEVSAPEEHAAAAEAPAAAPPAPEEHAAEAPAAAPPTQEEHRDDEKDQAVATKGEVEPPEAASAAAADDHHHHQEEESTRERLKRHRREMAGRVWVPEMWGQEKLLKEWVDCAVFDRPMVPTGLLTARRALIAECCTTTTRRPADRRTAPASASTTSSSPSLRVRNGYS